MIKRNWLFILGCVLAVAGVLVWLVAAWWLFLWGVDGDGTLAIVLTGIVLIVPGVMCMAIDAP